MILYESGCQLVIYNKLKIRYLLFTLIKKVKKIVFNILFCILFSGSLHAVSRDSQADTILSRDSLHIKSGKNYKTETVIIFNESKLAPQNVRIIFNELFRQYIAVKDALVYNDSYNSVRNTLKLLDDMRSKTKDIELLNKDDRWVFFINNFDNIRKKAESAKFISEQRFLFNEITNGLKDFIKHYGLYDKTIYLMKCTAVSQAGNTEWFSDSDDKKNPYLGLLNDTTNIKVNEVWKF